MREPEGIATPPPGKTSERPWSKHQEPDIRNAEAEGSSPFTSTTVPGHRAEAGCPRRSDSLTCLYVSRGCLGAIQLSGPPLASTPIEGEERLVTAMPVRSAEQPLRGFIGHTGFQPDLFGWVQSDHTVCTRRLRRLLRRSRSRPASNKCRKSDQDQAFVVTPHANQDSIDPTRPTITMGRRPTRSASRAPSIKRVAPAKVAAVRLRCKLAELSRNARPIHGAAAAGLPRPSHRRERPSTTRATPPGVDPNPNDLR